MAKSPPKRVATKKAPAKSSSKAAKSNTQTSKKSAPAKPSAKQKAGSGKASKPVTAKVLRPVTTAKAAKASTKQTTKSAVKIAAKPAPVVKPVAAKTTADKPLNGTAKAAKPLNGTPAVAETPKTPGRPMLMQGPVASNSITKKGTFIPARQTPPPVKLVKRKVEEPAPEFVTLQPPVQQVRTSEKAVKNRAGLNQRDLDFFRDLLLQKRRELVGDLSHMEREALRENNANLSNLPVHMADQGTDAYEQEFTLGLVEKDRTLLREINDAMAKIQNGTYGICEGTGNPIGRARLEAQPWARHSIEFARILEKRKMMFRR